MNENIVLLPILFGIAGLIASGVWKLERIAKAAEEIAKRISLQ